jgi:hypothetical protein
MELTNSFISTDPFQSSQPNRDNKGKFECKFCQRKFQFSDLYERHYYWCEFLCQGKRSRERQTEAYEQLPPPMEQFHLLQHCLVKIAKLEKEVSQLRGSIATRKRVAILQFLESTANRIRPAMSFQEWIRTIPVTTNDLQRVFDVDLVEGMKYCIQTMYANLNEQGRNEIPLAAFTQKKDTIYIYSAVRRADGESFNSGIEIEIETKRWIMMSSDDFDQWMNRFSHRFLKEFIQWQLDHSDQIHSSEEQKEKHMDYMRKINGLGRAYEDRRRGEFRKWLYGILAKDIHLGVDFV